MSIINELLRHIALPGMVRVRQRFPAITIQDVPGVLQAELRQAAIAGCLKDGMRIAVAVGSRGIADLPLIVRIVVEELRARGTQPFIVPAMGSHGGATAAGQTEILADLGVTESSAGCPVVSSMETVSLGTSANGLPVLMDKNAMQADGIVVINRVKPHTAFSGTYESGLAKMIAIGLGKQKGADACHARGFGRVAQFVEEVARFKLAAAPLLFGVATVENAYDRIAKIVAVPADKIMEREKGLLQEAKANMPRLLFNPLDVLIVDRMGKEYSGSGMDCYVTGHAGTPYVATQQKTGKMAVLDLTEKSHGNALAIGLADITTRRLFGKIDFAATYANALTSSITLGGMIPMIMDSDRLAVQAAIKTCNVPDPGRIRLMRIANTLHVEYVYISEGLLEEAKNHPHMDILGVPEEWPFDTDGNLTNLEL